ncbi:MAG: MBL fold metallo-hydrolase [Bacillota bacterium]|nr:MBL fold metallo-hydrolase [Bacillota bacterium]
MKIKFLGAARTVTGSCYLVTTARHKLLIDCGMFQGDKSTKELNYVNFEFDPKDIDFVLLTHAHIDHSGLLPKLVKGGFTGKIISTSATFELCKIMLPDSGFIQEMEVERKNRKNIRSGKPLLEPIYTVEDARNTISYFSPIEFNEEIKLDEGLKVVYRNSGHILGSAIIELNCMEEGDWTKVVCTGDIGDFNQPIIKDPVYIEEADYVIIESTYGNRLRHRHLNKKEELLKVINDTMAKKGNLIIPAFAVERTQDLLYYLALLEREGKLKGINIFVDSPLAISATEIFCNSIDYYDEQTIELMGNSDECPLLLPGLKFTRTAEESINLNKINSGAIIISASGMCDAGRIKHHLKHNLWRKEATILFVGYQAYGTLGRRLLNGEKQVKIHGEDINVRANISNIEGFSAHADQGALLKWLADFKKKPQKVFVTHGEEDSAIAFAKLVEDQLQIPAEAPERLAELELRPTKLEEPKKLLLNKLIHSIEEVRTEFASFKNQGFSYEEIEELINELSELEQKALNIVDKEVG